MEQTKWKEVLISWMSGKSFEFVEPRDEIEEVKGQEDWQIVDLEALLLKRGLIPEFVCRNDSLYDILLRRMQKQLLYSVNVPPRVQTSMTFGGLMNCRRMLLQDVDNGLQKSKRSFEKKTGVNLDHYYKMAQTKEQIQKRKRDMLDEQNEMREREKKGILLFFTTISSSYYIVKCVWDYCLVREKLLYPLVYCFYVPRGIRRLLL